MSAEGHEFLTLNTTLSEIYHQTEACVQTIRRAEERDRVFKRFLPLDRYTDIIVTRFFFLGSGPMKGLADECALKMTEMALNFTFSFRTLEG